MAEGTIKRADEAKIYDFTVQEGYITVYEDCPKWDLVNKYFAEHRLNRNDYTNMEISRLIEAVLFTVVDPEDQEVIESMLV